MDHDKEITYFKVLNKLDDCSSPVHIRTVLHTIGLKIRIAAVFKLVENRILDLRERSTDPLVYSMYSNILEDMEDVDVVQLRSSGDMRESKEDLFSALIRLRTPVAEIAQILGLSERSIKQTIGRIREK